MQEEPAVCSSVALSPVVHVPVARPVVMFWLGSDAPIVAGGSRDPVSCRSASVEVDHPHVDLALSSIPECLDHKEEFDDSLVRFYGYPWSVSQLLPPHAPLYNKFVGGNA